VVVGVVGMVRVAAMGNASVGCGGSRRGGNGESGSYGYASVGCGGSRGGGNGESGSYE